MTEQWHRTETRLSRRLDRCPRPAGQCHGVALFHGVPAAQWTGAWSTEAKLAGWHILEECRGFTRLFVWCAAWGQTDTGRLSTLMASIVRTTTTGTPLAPSAAVARSHSARDVGVLWCARFGIRTRDERRVALPRSDAVRLVRAEWDRNGQCSWATNKRCCSYSVTTYQLPPSHFHFHVSIFLATLAPLAVWPPPTVTLLG
jgi:hypothetical protein